MRKTIIYLPDDVLTRLKYAALDKQLSMAELIRRAVAQWLKKQRPRQKRGEL
jgi:hypothetical protein